jgi:hypothetical protein
MHANEGPATLPRGALLPDWRGHTWRRDVEEEMAHSDANAIYAVGTRADAAVEELRLVGGEITLEGRELAAAASAGGVNVRWLGFDSTKAQAAIAAQGPGAVHLPLVIVDSSYTLQRPPSTAVSGCVRALRAGDSTPPAGAVALRDDQAGDALSSIAARRGLSDQEAAVIDAPAPATWTAVRPPPSTDAGVTARRRPWRR